MNKLFYANLFAFVIWQIANVDGLLQSAMDMEKPKKCTRERTYYKLVGYTCSNLNLKEVPQTLKTGFDIFDLSYNRIRDLDKTSFEKYTDIKYLYLFENMIQSIEQDTFAELTSLEAIDLSNNALTTIPNELFKTRTLRNLYVSGNNLVMLSSDLKTIEKPIPAPIQILSIADCRLRFMPDFGVMPELWQLNISNNPLIDIGVEHFAPFCNLKKLDWNNTDLLGNVCKCQRLTSALVAKNVNIEVNGMECDLRYLYSTEYYGCSNNQNGTTLDEFEAYKTCTAIRASRKKTVEAKTTWFVIAAIVGGCLFVLVLGLYCLHRRNSKHIKKSKLKSVSPVRVLVPIAEEKSDSKLIDPSD